MQYAADTTKQDFAHVIQTLLQQMVMTTQTLTAQLKEKDEIILTDLSQELGTPEEIANIILKQFLDLKLFPQPDNRYFTEKGIRNLLINKFNEKNSLLMTEIMKNKPFDELDQTTISALLSEISSYHLVNQELYVLNEYYTNLSNNFQASGLLPLNSIANELEQPFDVIKQEFINAIIPSDDGWMNERKEYLTTKFVYEQSREFIVQNHILELSQFLQHLGKPKIDHATLRQIINSHSQGKWFDDINVFLTIEEFREIEENAIRIDEERVSHLLAPINLDFPKFLETLQKLLEIQTFKTKSGQLISLESLFPEIDQEVEERKFLAISEYCSKNNLDDSVKSIILSRLEEKFRGQVDHNKHYFFDERLLTEIKGELEKQTRINYNVFSFRLDLTPELLRMIISDILDIRGFHNNLDEFITIDGAIKEYKELTTHNVEFPIVTLYEILEIVNNKQATQTILGILRADTELKISTDETKIFTKQRAIDKIIRFSKNPITRSKESISLSEISQELGLSQSDIEEIITTLVNDNQVSGKLQNKNYYP